MLHVPVYLYVHGVFTMLPQRYKGRTVTEHIGASSCTCPYSARRVMTLHGAWWHQLCSMLHVASMLWQAR
jgi:hypothetical protein